MHRLACMSLCIWRTEADYIERQAQIKQRQGGERKRAKCLSDNMMMDGARDFMPKAR